MAGNISLRRLFVHIRQTKYIGRQLRASQIYRPFKVTRLWQIFANHSNKVCFGTFISSSLAASRGFSLWSSKPKEPEAIPEPVQVSPTEEADRLYEDNKTVELYDFLVRFKDTNDDDLLWRLARACRGVAQLSTTRQEDKKRLTYEALDYAQRALKQNDGNFAAHKWYAICLSEVGDYEGTKQKISNAFVIRDHFERAIYLNPQDATSVHLLGLWCFTFADMPWYQKKVAAVVFTTPPSSSYEEALAKFVEAEKVSPNFYSKNLLMIGKTYQKMGNTKLALLYLTKARDYPPKTEEDVQANNEARGLLASMGHK